MINKRYYLLFYNIGQGCVIRDEDRPVEDRTGQSERECGGRTENLLKTHSLTH